MGEIGKQTNKQSYNKYGPDILIFGLYFEFINLLVNAPAGQRITE